MHRKLTVATSGGSVLSPRPPDSCLRIGNLPPDCTVRSLISGGSFLLTHCPQICIWKEISRPDFLDVSRFSVMHSIDLRRVFLRWVNISMCKFGDSVSCLGLYGGLYGQNLPLKFKKSYGDFRNRNFEKSHRTTGPRSDLRPVP